MNDMEHMALKHLAEEMAYRRSPQYKTDQIADRKRRAEADRNAGHSPLCSLSKCHSSCGKG